MYSSSLGAEYVDLAFCVRSSGFTDFKAAVYCAWDLFLSVQFCAIDQVSHTVKVMTSTWSYFLFFVGVRSPGHEKCRQYIHTIFRIVTALFKTVRHTAYLDSSAEQSIFFKARWVSLTALQIAWASKKVRRSYASFTKKSSPEYFHSDVLSWWHRAWYYSCTENVGRPEKCSDIQMQAGVLFRVPLPPKKLS